MNLKHFCRFSLFVLVITLLLSVVAVSIETSTFEDIDMKEDLFDSEDSPYSQEDFEDELFIESISREIYKAPDYAYLYFWRGYKYYTMEKYSEAIDDFKTVLKINPKDNTSRYYLGIL